MRRPVTVTVLAATPHLRVPSAKQTIALPRSAAMRSSVNAENSVCCTVLKPPIGNYKILYTSNAKRDLKGETVYPRETEMRTARNGPHARLRFASVSRLSLYLSSAPPGVLTLFCTDDTIT